jgi:circadian clock protein KaiC
MAESDTSTHKRPRLATGVPGLDTILAGGFLRGGIYIVEGEPGAGKTILANQICSAEVAAGHHALYVTLLTESHAGMMANLSTLSFFDERAIPGALYYVSGFAALEEEGLRGLLDLVRREIRNHQARILVIDGLVSAEEVARSNSEMKKFVQELQSHCELAGCTTFLLTSGSANTSERTMVDGLIELSDPGFGNARERRMEVTKFRGTGFLRGRHSFDITNDGIAVYPRSEAFLRLPEGPEPLAVEKVSTGSRSFDEILRGGLPHASTSMLLGPPGSGKTSMGLQFLSLCRRDDPGVYLSFYETRRRAERKASQLGIGLGKLIDEGTIYFAWEPTTENIVDRIVGGLVAAVERTKAQRVFIDGLDGFSQLSQDENRLVRIFTAITNQMRALGATTVYTAESHSIFAHQVDTPPTGVSTMVENLISLRYAEMDSRVRRVISILKVRDSDYDPLVREMAITDHGIEVGKPLSGWENLHGGAAHRNSSPQRGDDRDR